MTTAKSKAKRKLSDFDFSSEDSHIALVGPEVGGPANQRTTLIFKASKKYSDEFLQKMQQIQVTLELPEFLRRFFEMYYEDAEVLARMIGYVQPEDGDNIWCDEEYIKNRLKSYKIIKSLENEKDPLSKASELPEEQYLTLLKDQEIFEKALKQKELADASGKAENLAKAKQKSPKTEEKTQMTVKEVEMVEKSALTQAEAKSEKLEKALDAQKEQLQKALDALANIEKERKETVTKARFSVLQDVVKDKDHSETLFKALDLVEDPKLFGEVIEVLKKMQSAVEASKMFQEVGSDGDSDSTSEDEVEAVIKQIKKQQASQAR